MVSGDQLLSCNQGLLLLAGNLGRVACAPGFLVGNIGLIMVTYPMGL